MPRWLRRTLIVIAAILVVGAGGYWWYIADGNPPSTLPAFSLDLAAVRAKAEALPGGKPNDIRVETVAKFSFPAVASVGGDGWNVVPMGVFSYQVVLPTETLIIDTALDATLGATMGALIDDDAYARMDAAMADATQIVVTHEHLDHIGGIVEYPQPAAIRKQLRLNTEQVLNLGRYNLVLPDALKDIVPIDYVEPLAIAPGVVLIRAPGHSPGSQIVYVKRADSKELLFIGDIAWTVRNLETGKSRPRLVSDVILNEDRGQVFAELEALRALQAAEPDILIVPGHDLAAIDALVAAGAMENGFSP